MAKLPNLRKVLWAEFYWTRKGSNARRDEKPVNPTFNGTEFDPDEIVDNAAGHSFTRLDHAKKLGGPDIWFAHIELRFSANNTFVTTGSEAEKLWDAYKGVVYAK